MFCGRSGAAPSGAEDAGVTMGTGTYRPPEVRDYGSLIDLTAAQGLFGAEDGGSKLDPFHHVPAPSAPAQP